MQRPRFDQVLVDASLETALLRGVNPGMRLQKKKTKIKAGDRRRSRKARGSLGSGSARGGGAGWRRQRGRTKQPPPRKTKLPFLASRISFKRGGVAQNGMRMRGFLPTALASCGPTLYRKHGSAPTTCSAQSGEATRGARAREMRLARVADDGHGFPAPERRVKTLRAYARTGERATFRSFVPKRSLFSRA